MPHDRRLLTTLAADYGIVFVLLLLCVFFSGGMALAKRIDLGATGSASARRQPAG